MNFATPQIVKKAEVSFLKFPALLCFLAATVLHNEGLTVGALILCRVLFVRTYMDFVERAVIHA